ncbi:hypothetical protein KZX46_14260 [Polymorphobacter sp. PAMC 29334]|uniref:hypothetical protein n=1 Tax=Polymorphobacter sp. PAMC 29334 TaxID=2862331 RepID=UPI001C772030|nr:hypothetical protein [Polymorphobacter sp. PAMC 29334]QYE33978.1 hypothetical protein KZX46_14260 [Polymorphobacter sp. PAMC 29334]
MTRPMPPLPRPTFVQAPAAYPFPCDGWGESDAWGEWQARIDATAHERRMDPAVEATLLANDAIFRRRVAEQRGR